MLSSLHALTIKAVPTRLSKQAASSSPSEHPCPQAGDAVDLSAQHAEPSSNVPLSAWNRLMIRMMAAGYLKMPRLPAEWRGFLAPEAYRKMTGLPMETVSFTSVDGIPLKGYRFPIPEAAKTSHKAVILGHGYCANAGNMLPLIRPFHAMGYHVFLFDFRAHGQSGGARTSIGFHEGKDIAAAVRFLKEHHPAESKEIVYLGHSMGAAAFLMAPKSLESHPTERQTLLTHLNSAILDSSYAVIKPSEDPYVAGFLQEKQGNSGWVKPTSWLNHAKRWAQNLVKGFETQSAALMDLPAPINQLFPARIYRQNEAFRSKPLLILHGKQDTRTPFKDAETIVTTLTDAGPSGQSPVKTVHFVPLEADHFVTDWQPKPGKRAYKSILRDEERYIQSIGTFLVDQKPALTLSNTKGEPEDGLAPMPERALSESVPAE